MHHVAGFDVVLAIAMGVGLAAATGFRVFLPMLVLSVGAYTGHLALSSGLAWLGTSPALVMLGVATAIEILAYYIPGLDNLLDVVATPAALLAGIVASAAVMTDLPPMIRRTAAVIAGGGVAGATQGLTALLRAKSTVMTAGVGNHALATIEIFLALIVSVLALAAPLAAVAVTVLLCSIAVWLLRRLAPAAKAKRSRRGP